MWVIFVRELFDKCVCVSANTLQRSYIDEAVTLVSNVCAADVNWGSYGRDREDKIWKQQWLRLWVSSKRERERGKKSQENRQSSNSSMGGLQLREACVICYSAISVATSNEHVALVGLEQGKIHTRRGGNLQDLSHLWDFTVVFMLHFQQVASVRRMYDVSF